MKNSLKYYGIFLKLGVDMWIKSMSRIVLCEAFGL